MIVPLSERLQRLTAWFHRANDRPLIGFTLGSYYPLKRYPQGARWIPNGEVRPEHIKVSDYLDDSDELFHLHQAAGGDLIWSATPFLGLPWVEAALGCGVVADHQSGSTRSIPPPGFAENHHVPAFSEANPWVAKLLEFIPPLEQRSAGRYPVGATLMRGVSDLLAALYGGGDFVLRMLDAPEEIESVVEQLADFWIAFGRCLLERLPLYHGGTGGYMYSLWCPGKTIWLQEDAVALLSPQLYRRFIFEADCRIARAFEHTALHLHPSRVIPSDDLIKSGIDVIELHIDHDGPRAAALEKHYRTILAAKPLLVWGDVTEADLEFLLRELPHQGLAVNLVVGSPEQAHATWDRAMRLWRGR